MLKTNRVISDPYADGLRCYEQGEFAAAAIYWDPLVEKGDCDAEYRLGVLYFLGQGEPHDNRKAVLLWRKAADGNHPKAQAAMGDIYYQNDSIVFHHCVECDIQKDFVQAYTWYKLAEKSARYGGDKDYVGRVLKAITEEMSKEQIAAGDKAVAQWRPTPRDCKPRDWR